MKTDCLTNKKYNKFFDFVSKIFNVQDIGTSCIDRKKITILGLKFTLKFNDSIIKKQNQVAQYLKDTYVEPYLHGNLPHYDLQPKQDLDSNKVIWQYWGQGFDETSPEIVKICFNSVDKYKGDYKRIILTNNNIHEYLDLPDFVYEKLNNKQYSYTFFSDLLRVALLSAYGGVWIDATVLLTEPIKNTFLQDDFFSFQRVEKPLDYKAWEAYNNTYFSWEKKFRVNWLSSFIVAKKGNIIVKALRDLLLAYWKNEDVLRHYFVAHLFFDELMQLEEFKKCNLNKNSDIPPHLMQFSREKQYTKELWDDILAQSGVHKLSWWSPKPKSILEHVYLVSK